jgi:hypothetical protein
LGAGPLAGVGLSRSIVSQVRCISKGAIISIRWRRSANGRRPSGRYVDRCIVAHLATSAV